MQNQCLKPYIMLFAFLNCKDKLCKWKINFLMLKLKNRPATWGIRIGPSC